ncbi:30S ribosomal protein S19e [Candidatus Woesearchaeota archaeon]|nr:30S ribosomal protein S19e [Candidatus Woesearchaeota archaeon]
MTHILTVNPIELNKKVAEELKKQKLVQPTVWSKFVKTGHHKDRLPDNPEWWYARSAAVLRSVAKLGPVGTEKLRTKFGGRKRRGYLPGHFYKASGSILRKILQQLEKSGLIQQTQKGVHKGRILTPKGTSLLDKIAVQMSKQEHKDSQ